MAIRIVLSLLIIVLIAFIIKAWLIPILYISYPVLFWLLLIIFVVMGILGVWYLLFREQE